MCGQGSTCGHEDRDALRDAPPPYWPELLSPPRLDQQSLYVKQVCLEDYLVTLREGGWDEDDEEEEVCTKMVTTQWLANICIDNIPIVISSYVLDDFVNIFENIRRRAKENVIKSALAHAASDRRHQGQFGRSPADQGDIME